MRLMPRLFLLLCLLCAAAPLQATEDPDLPACYRVGRCDMDDLRDERLIRQRFERLAPRPPDNMSGQALPSRQVPPTPTEEVREPYRAAGEVRAEFQQSGTALRP